MMKNDQASMGRLLLVAHDSQDCNVLEYESLIPIHSTLLVICKYRRYSVKLEFKIGKCRNLIR